MLILNPVNGYSSAFPILESVHIAGIICGVGTAALVNFRLLGVGLTRNSAARLWRDAMPWTLGGLTLAIFSGLLLFSIDPEMYYANHAFRFKMLFLLLAIAFYYTMVRKAQQQINVEAGGLSLRGSRSGCGRWCRSAGSSSDSLARQPTPIRCSCPSTSWPLCS